VLTGVPRKNIQFKVVIECKGKELLFNNADNIFQFPFYPYIAHLSRHEDAVGMLLSLNKLLMQQRKKIQKIQ
jgi:hypothetical protein